VSARQIKQQDPDQPAFKKYFMHGVGHPIGLDVHDVGITTRPVQAGWVMTVEPAIYLREEGFAVRLENDVLVTEGEPVDLMADIPIEPDEIETLMNGSPKPRIASGNGRHQRAPKPQAGGTGRQSGRTAALKRDRGKGGAGKWPGQQDLAIQFATGATDA